jgi:ribosomal-protein-alanine N-acetyltransferase
VSETLGEYNIQKRNHITEERIFKLDQEFFPQPWKKIDWEIIFKNTEIRIFIINDNKGNLCGCALFQLDEYLSQAHLLKIIVGPMLRGKGLGFDLLSYAFEELKALKYTNVFLEVSTKNEGALSLYRRLNFKVLTLKKKFYSSGEDAYAMQFVFE